MNIGSASLSHAWASTAFSGVPVQPVAPVQSGATSADPSQALSSGAVSSSSAPTANAAQSLDRMMHNRIFQAEQARAARLAGGGSSAQAQRYAQVAGASDDPSMDASVTLSHG